MPPGTCGRTEGQPGTCVCPHVGPEVAGLLEALPTLCTDEVSLVGLCPEHPWWIRRVGEGDKDTVSLSDARDVPAAPGHTSLPLEGHIGTSMEHNDSGVNQLP